MNVDVRDYAASNLRNVIIKNDLELYNLAEYVIEILRIEEPNMDEIMEILKNYVDLSFWEDDDELEELEPTEEEIEDDDEWIDPAGGIHYGNEDDPAAQYESLQENLNNPCNGESKLARIQLKNILNNAGQILNQIGDCQELEAWVQSYLTKADDYLESIRKNLAYGQDETTIIEPIPIPSTPPTPEEPIVPSIEDFEVDYGEDEIPAESVPQDVVEPESVPGEAEDEGPEIEEPEDMEEIPTPKEEEEDEITFDDIDFLNQQEDFKDELDQEEIKNDFSDIDDEIGDEDEGEEVEEETEKGEELEESFKNKQIVEMFIDNYPWYVKKIDNTHFFMSNNQEDLEKGKGWPYHIGEHKKRVYYNDLNEWLHGGKSPEGKNFKMDYL
jgi:hypothetical protein